MKPYVLLADIHFHNWNAFSKNDGINSRLAGLRSEVGRAASEIRAAGGDSMYIAGDVFHVRGSIAPSVLNPVLDLFREFASFGIKVRILAGNHDLEGKKRDRISSAITSLESAGVEIINDVAIFNDDHIVMVPWSESIADLKDEITKLAKDNDVHEYDLLLHAPIDGVIFGLPDHGLDAKFFDDLPFRRVFAGHYHNHLALNDRVYSIGALAHQTWSDVGSKAGFLIVGDEVRWMKSHLPEFIDITADTDIDELPLLVDGNYVRARTESSKMSDVGALRLELEGMGAAGVVIQTVKKPVAARDGGISEGIKSGATLEKSVASYIASQSFADAGRVATEAMSVLAEAGC